MGRRKVDQANARTAEDVVAAAAPKFWRISRHVNARLNNTEADAILAEGMRILRDVNGSGDVSCPIDIRRDGDVSTFSVGNGIISSGAEWQAVCNTGGRVHVVSQLNYCGGRIGSFLGCSSSPGSCMVLVRTDADIEAILWMHEYGHNQGLPDFPNSPGWVMQGYISADDLKVDSDDCRAYQEPERMALMAPAAPPRFPTPTAKNVEEFVRRIYVHSVPYEGATQFGAGDVEVLLRMLSDRDEERYWTNVVITLCMIGDLGALEPLREFILSGDGTLSSREFDAKCAALLHLGLILNRAGAAAVGDALRFLADGLSPTAWAERIRWRNPYGLSGEEQAAQLSKLTVWSLAVSGLPEAGAALRSLTGDSGVRADVSSLLEQALEQHAIVVSGGLDAYYGFATSKPALAAASAPSIETLSAAVEKTLAQVLNKASQERGQLDGANDKRLLFPDGIELIDVEFGLGIEPTKPNFTVKVHIHGPNAKADRADIAD